MASNMVIFIVLLVYLVGLGFLFNAVGKDLTIAYTSSSFNGLGSSSEKDFNWNNCDCGTMTCSNYWLFNSEAEMKAIAICPTGISTSSSISVNIIRGVEGMPVWLNVIFIIIPVALLVWLGVLIWLHG